MGVLHRQTLLNVASVSATGGWYEVDWRMGADQLRGFTGSLTAGDTVFLEVTNELVVQNGVTVNPTVVVTVSGFTATPFAGTISGPFSALRFRKTGTTGPATVIALV